jgi:hypothetical protein
LDHRMTACVVSCMTATFASLVPYELDTHSWLLHVPRPVVAAGLA